MYNFLASIMALFGKDRFNTERNEANRAYLTRENFELIRDSSQVDPTFRYWIAKTENRLTFSREPDGYSLFFLILTDSFDEPVVLKGLDGYGLRDRDFLNIVCRYIDMLVENE